MSQIKQAVILAGGLGTRMKPFTDSAPKAMYPVAGIPFIEHLVLQIRDFGINNILILLGYLPEGIIKHLGNGGRWGVDIRYSTTPVAYDTGKRLKACKEMLAQEFLLMYCDNYCPVDFPQLCSDFLANHALVQITAYKNSDQYTKSNLRIAEGGEVTLYDKTRLEKGLKGVDIGYAIVNRRVIDLLSDENINFESSLYPQLSATRQLFATVTEHRYYSIGSWDKLQQTSRFFSSPGAVFLDRDGTLNVKPPRAEYVESVQDFHWIAGAAKAVKLLKNAGYLVFIVTNQPGIARGRLSTETLLEINARIQMDLHKEKTAVDHIYHCPHNWNDGCFCRKPNPGMLYQAQKDYCLNLRDCFLFGDDERDMDAAKRAGCTGILVSEAFPLLSAVQNFLTGRT